MRISILANAFVLVILVGNYANTQSITSASPVVAEKPGQANPGALIVKGRAVFEDTGQPAQRERIQLVAVELLANRRGPFRLPTTMTDLNGEFTFLHATAGEYFVVGHPIDERVSSAEAAPFPFQNGDPVADAARMEQFRRDNPKITVNAGSPAEINLRVKNPHFGEISGRIADTNAGAVAKANVHAMNTGEKGFGAATIADENGAYLIRGLPAGKYLVSADPPGKIPGAQGTHGISGVLGSTYFPSTIDSRTSPPVTVFPDREVGDINITLAQRSLYSVSGTVKGEGDGHPIAGAALRLYRKDLDRAGMEATMSNAFFTSDEQGHWVFNNLPDGEYMIELRPSPLLSAKFERFVNKTVALTVAGMDHENVAIYVSRGVRVSGSVTIEQEGAPGQVSARDVSIGIGSAMTRVDANGEFSAAGVPLGEFPLAVLIRPQNGFYAKSIQLNGVDLLREELNTTAGADIKDVHIVIAPASVLTGRVMSAAFGKPLSGITVYLVPVDPTTSPAFARPNGTTNAAGVFIASGAPGEYFVVMWVLGGIFPRLDSFSIKQWSPNALRVTLEPGESKSMDLFK